jgi:hypothetical protein
MVLMSTGQARKMCLGLAVIGMLESTLRASLTCILRVYSNQPSTSFFRFVQSSCWGANSQEVGSVERQSRLRRGESVSWRGKREGNAYLCLGNNPVCSGQIRLYANAIRSRAMSCLFPSGGQKSVAGCLTQNRYPCLTRCNRCNQPNALCIKEVCYWSFRVRCRC